ncbi:diaminopimelate epimerase [Acaricomes phytoseiuli]|uniref:diaminopimelate epimerase n=1 Tax=Acaricomes phytoseiuli TaxID=291968 RepID=UPI00037ED681|nr:diaminopimelate epimerase [Acaricomes phytoseiuli]MCW1248816.1 diaminopimelate epimerase [Acaricomes phytoseiuli]
MTNSAQYGEQHTSPADQEADALSRLSGVKFAKGHGIGNDFVLFEDAEEKRPVDAALAAAVCDRHRGLGADGLIRAVRSQELPEGRELLAQEPRAEWFMDYRNADGSLAQMCGNGVRVFVDFLVHRGLVWLEPGEVLPVATRSGIKNVERLADGYAADLGPWRLSSPEEAELRGVDSLVTAYALDVARPGLSISTGNPHTVVALATQEELVELDLSRPPKVNPEPAEGANVEFALPRDPLVVDGVAAIAIRVHERGSGETLSCGTGACAAAAATRFWAGANAPDLWDVTVPGGTLRVRFITAPSGAEHIELSGPAKIIAEGVVL